MGEWKGGKPRTGLLHVAVAAAATIEFFFWHSPTTSYSSFCLLIIVVPSFPTKWHTVQSLARRLPVLRRFGQHMVPYRLLLLCISNFVGRHSPTASSSSFCSEIPVRHRRRPQFPPPNGTYCSKSCTATVIRRRF